MKNLFDWCIRHASKSSLDLELFDFMDTVVPSLYTNFIKRKVTYNEKQLRALTITDIVQAPVKKQHYLLLAHLFATGIENIPVERVGYYIDWLIDCPYVDAHITAYIWHKSKLNSMSNFACHSLIIDIIDDDINSYTLRFLYDAAKTGDKVLCDIIMFTASRVGTPYYLKMLVYTYLCSNCTPRDLAMFFADINKVSRHDVLDVTDVFTTYTWSNRVVRDCVSKNITIKTIIKHLLNNGNSGFIAKGREFPIHLFMSTPKFKYRVNSDQFKGLPKVPTNYCINYCFWNNLYAGKTFVIKKSDRSKYTKWFNNLSTAQKDRLRKEKPKTFSMCSKGEFEYVKESVDAIMCAEGR